MHTSCPQNIMPLSAAMFLSERKNPAPQCPPRLEMQMLMPISWSRMPNHFLQVDTRRASERLGWAVHCQEPLTMMALHIPEENRSAPAQAPRAGQGCLQPSAPQHTQGLQAYLREPRPIPQGSKPISGSPNRPHQTCQRGSDPVQGSHILGSGSSL